MAASAEAVEIADIFGEIVSKSLKYCCLCLRTEKERELVEPVSFLKCSNVMKLHIPRMSAVCNLCEAAAGRALALWRAARLAALLDDWLQTVKDKILHRDGAADHLERYYKKLNRRNSLPSEERVSLPSAWRRLRTFDDAQCADTPREDREERAVHTKTQHKGKNSTVSMKLQPTLVKENDDSTGTVVIIEDDDDDPTPAKGSNGTPSSPGVQETPSVPAVQETPKIKGTSSSRNKGGKVVLGISSDKATGYQGVSKTSRSLGVNEDPLLKVRKNRKLFKYPKVAASKKPAPSKPIRCYGPSKGKVSKVEETTKGIATVSKMCAEDSESRVNGVSNTLQVSKVKETSDKATNPKKPSRDIGASRVHGTSNISRLSVVEDTSVKSAGSKEASTGSGILRMIIPSERDTELKEPSKDGVPGVKGSSSATALNEGLMITRDAEGRVLLVVPSLQHSQNEVIIMPEPWPSLVINQGELIPTGANVEDNTQGVPDPLCALNTLANASWLQPDPLSVSEDPLSGTQDPICSSEIGTLRGSQGPHSGTKSQEIWTTMQEARAARPVDSGRIDWEDKIPMDVISFVKSTDNILYPSKGPPPLTRGPQPKRPHSSGGPPQGSGGPPHKKKDTNTYEVIDLG